MERFSEQRRALAPRPNGGAVALLAAGGVGERLGGSVPKAFVELAKKPLLVHAMEALDRVPDVEAVVVAVPPGHEDEAKALIAGSSKLHAIVAGGETRQSSIRAALAAAPDGFDVVVCHDVARPLASPDLYAAVLSALRDADGGIPVVPVVDTVKRMEDDAVGETVSRDGLVLVQTPQAFRREALEQAHESAGRDGVEATDDAALLERERFRVRAVPGDPANLKITGPEDLRIAEQLIRG